MLGERNAGKIYSVLFCSAFLCFCFVTLSEESGGAGKWETILETG